MNYFSDLFNKLPGWLQVVLGTILLFSLITATVMLIYISEPIWLVL